MWYKKFLLILIAGNILQSPLAQKTDKGSSADKPWADDPPSMSSTFANSMKLEFGKWNIKASNGYFSETNIIADTTDMRTGLKIGTLNTDNLVRRRLLYISNFLFAGTDPDKNSFSGSFNFTDSIGEEFRTHGFMFTKTEGHHDTCFLKTADGYIHTSANDSVLFHLKVSFFNTIPEIDQESLIETSEGPILMKPLFVTKIPQYNKDRRLYTGFSFQKGDSIIAAAEVKKGFMGYPEYKYWMNPDLNSHTEQIVASLLYVIVGFF